MSRIFKKKVTTRFGNIKYYRTVNKELDFDILFIHGLGGNKEWFLSHFETHQLKKFSWIVPDLIGYGNSSKPNRMEAYTADNQASNLLHLLMEEEVHSVVIFAHSMGGPIAISLIEQLHQQMVQRIEVSCLLYLEGNLDKKDAFFSSLIADYKFNEYENIFESWLDDLNQKSNGKLIDFITELRNIGPFPLWASSVDLLTVSESNQLLPRLQSIIKLANCQVYFLYGEKSKGKYTSETLIEQSQLPLIFIPDAGHTMYDDNPEAFWNITKRIIVSLNTQ